MSSTRTLILQVYRHCLPVDDVESRLGTAKSIASQEYNPQLCKRLCMTRLYMVIFLFLTVQSAWAQTTRSSLEEASLLGTWQHVSSSDSVETKGKPLGSAEIKWTFKADGKGLYSQKVPALGKTRTRPMTWKLEGNTIVLGGKTKYTVESFDGDSMVWKNERLGDYYHVERR